QLTGCNSEGAFSKLERIDIVASPITTHGVSELTLAAGNKQPFEAIGYYSDGSSHALTDLNTSDWHTSDQDIGYFEDPGVLIGGNTPGIVTVYATQDGITSNKVEVTVTAAVITDIQVTPSPVSVAKGQTQQLTATATYDDSTSYDVTSSVTWTPVDTATATVTSAGVLSGVEVGTTTLTATKDGVPSNVVMVIVTECSDLAGACIDIVDTGSGKLFTNSPSVAYLNSIGGSAADDIYTEDGSFGPAGNFYLFSWDNANALCATYNTQSIGGRTNWRLATRDELRNELFGTFGNMFNVRGWPTTFDFWSTTAMGSKYRAVDLYFGKVSLYSPSLPIYVSCVSEP
ncbi:MAG: Ig-like domain-containing protein, partial [Shewanella sp.]|nr:Ig-like domain-containing protein [Shewanella sp.]